MRPSKFQLLSCPKCRGELFFPAGQAQNGFGCRACQRCFPIVDETIQFASEPEIAVMYPDVALQSRVGARFYDSLVERRMAEITGITPQDARHEYFRQVDWRDGLRVLDVGVGTGGELVQLARQNRALEMHALDLSIEMLRQCRRRLRLEGIGASLYLGLAEELPFRSDTFDVVFHMGAFNEFVDKARVLAELTRVARVGGQVLVADECLTSENIRTEVGSRLRTAFPSMCVDPELPTRFVPSGVSRVRHATILDGFAYCTSFVKTEHVSVSQPSA